MRVALEPYTGLYPPQFEAAQWRMPKAADPAGTERVILLPNGWRRFLGFPARAVAGPLNALERLASEVRIGMRKIPKSVLRVVVYSRFDSPVLRESDRDFLWHAFQLPVFEQVRGCDGELLAWECDAHSGLHLNAGCAEVEPPAGLSVRRAPGLCACGQRSPRLIFTPTAPSTAAGTGAHRRLHVSTVCAAPGIASKPGKTQVRSI